MHGGVSTLAILSAGKGHLTSVDVNYRNHAHEEVEVNGLRERWTFEHSDSHDFWQDNELKYDLIYVDGSHKWPQCFEDMVEAWEVLEKGGVLICDDFVHSSNQKMDTDGSVEYGVSFAICNLIRDKKIRKIYSTDKLFVAFK